MESLQATGRWFKRKQYQLEVTFGVYMFTPIEKDVFWSIVFLLFSLTFIATVLYLPQHVVFLYNRAWFYVHGDENSGVERVLSGLAKNALQRTADALPPATTSTANAAAAAAETLVREL